MLYAYLLDAFFAVCLLFLAVFLLYAFLLIAFLLNAYMQVREHEIFMKLLLVGLAWLH